MSGRNNVDGTYEGLRHTVFRIKLNSNLYVDGTYEGLRQIGSSFSIMSKLTFFVDGTYEELRQITFFTTYGPLLVDSTYEELIMWLAGTNRNYLGEFRLWF